MHRPISACTNFSANRERERERVKISAGFMFSPQGTISLEKPRKTEVLTSFFAVIPITYRGWFITPFYSFENSTGIAVEKAISKNCGMYVVNTKNTTKHDGYSGIGIDTPVFNGNGSAFVEFGSARRKYAPCLFVGVFVPFTTVLCK